MKNNRPLTKAELDELEQLEQIAKNKQAKTKKKKSGATIAAEQILKTQKEAAKHVGRTVRTIRRWVQEGMPRTAEGYYIKAILDIWKGNEGKQHSEARERKDAGEADLKEAKARLAQLELEEKLGQIDKRVEEKMIPKIIAFKRGLFVFQRRIINALPPEYRWQFKAKIEQEITYLIDGFIR